jgi:membrane protein
MPLSILAVMAPILRKFFADRGTHLAAMIAYFALLSFVPLLFLSLALLGTADQADSGSFFVRELHRTFPSTSLDSVLNAVHAIQDNATALGIVGAAFFVWSALSLFSVLESAFNIVYDQPNRPFLHGKALASLMMFFSLTFLYSSLVVGSIGVELLKRYTGLSDNLVFAWFLTVTVSLVGIFVFLASAYVVLTNVSLRWREVTPGAAVAAVLLEATFQALPLYVRASKHDPVLQTLSGPAVLLVWLYVMANLIVLGAEVNFHLRARRTAMPQPSAGLAPPAPDASSDVSTRRRSPRPFGNHLRG